MSNPALKNKPSSIFTDNHHPMWIFEKNTFAILDVNEIAVSNYEYSRDEFLKMSFSDLIFPKDSKKFLELIHNQSQPLIHSGVWKHRRRSGSIIEVEITLRDIEFDGKDAVLVMAEDITERLLKEKQLQEAQQIAHLGYWEWDLITKKLEWSDELYRIYGLDQQPQNITYEKYISMIHHEDRSFIKNTIDASLINYEPFKMDHRIVLQNGVVRYIRGIGEVVLNDEKKPVKLQGIGQDITDLKIAEHRLKSQLEVTRILSESKNLYDAYPKILQAICEGFDWEIGELWLADYENNLLQLEGSWFIQGIEADEFIEISKKCKFGPGVSLQGRVWESRTPMWSGNVVDDQFFPRTALAAKLKLNTALAFPIECRKNIIGVMAFYKDNIAEPDSELLAMLDSLGKQIGDFIERKQSEPALQESENLYKILVDISPDAITYTDLSGKIIFCNLQAAELFGFKLAEEMAAQNVYAFIAPEDQKNAIENENRTIESGSTKNIEYTLIKKNGERFFAEVNTSIVFDANKKPKAFIGVMRDITERKKNEDEIKIRIKQQAVIAELGLHALAGGELHDLMNKAAELVTKTLELEFCEILEFIPEEESFLLKAGLGWGKDYAGKIKLSSGKGSHAGFTLLSKEPIIAENYNNEKRFKASKLLRDHKIISGITVIIPGKNHPYGVLGAHNSKHKSFTKNDSHFLQAIANTLSTAIERKNVEDELALSLKKSQQLQQQAEDSKKRLEFLAEASSIFNSSLDYYKTLTSVANLATPAIADWCVVDLMEADGTLKRVAVSNVDSGQIEMAHELEKNYPMDPNPMLGVDKVIRTGESELYP